MTMPFGEQSKFFTAVISKEAIDVTIQTLTHLIKGQIHVKPGERLKDGINQTELFLALTNATILDSNGKELYHTGFLAVNRTHVIWLLPDEQTMSEK